MNPHSETTELDLSGVNQGNIASCSGSSQWPGRENTLLKVSESCFFHSSGQVFSD